MKELSTVARCKYNLQPPEGSPVLQGYEVRKFSARELRCKILTFANLLRYELE